MGRAHDGGDDHGTPPRITDATIAEIAASALDLLARVVTPVAAELPNTLVHQDLHDSNVLADADGGIAAFIDFDDMLVGWRVAEPAIAAAYLARHTDDPRAAVDAVAAGWEAALPLQRQSAARIAHSCSHGWR
ncbi:phosphotransferase [Leucobacter luti]|uniref:phosphotransferase n=1 Tax=Leucobacter luti TaxID=340320 RepID=UPI001C693B81|nr:phosphotransferase [Leucobacter luti]QYM75521.1 phosphotransferase [Leucobacter luti]